VAGGRFPGRPGVLDGLGDPGVQGGARFPGVPAGFGGVARAGPARVARFRRVYAAPPASRPGMVRDEVTVSLAGGGAVA